MPVFRCTICRTTLSADDAMSGQLVRCPQCMTTMKVPTADMVAVGAPPEVVRGLAVPPPPKPRASSTSTSTSLRPPALPSVATAGQLRAGGGRRYGFNCAYCSSRLEATEASAGQDGQCPTCGSMITIPIMDRYGRLIDPKSGEVIKQDPHPVHAYAAAGERAPRILRQDNVLSIQCPKCNAISPVSANNCRQCGMPFTMEGTFAEAGGGSNSFSVASLVLGIISMPLFCTVVAGPLAIIFGAIGYSNASRAGAGAGGKGMAIAGIICGAVGSTLSFMWMSK